MSIRVFFPDFDGECRLCGTSPTVQVQGHKQPDTELCGPHFFQDRKAVNWDIWNETDEDEV